MAISADKLILTNAWLCPIIPLFKFAPFGAKSMKFWFREPGLKFKLEQWSSPLDYHWNYGKLELWNIGYQ